MHVDATPIQGDVFAQVDVLAQTVVPVQVNELAQAFVLSQADALPRANEPARGDYEAMAKRTRSISAHGSTCLAKKPRCSLTITISSTRFGSCRSCRGRF